MIINQQVSSPIAPSSGSGIQSPSFSKPVFSTQLTVQDGDTGSHRRLHTGNLRSYLQRRALAAPHSPYGSRIRHEKASTKPGPKLIVFLTPAVIYDTNQISDATVRDSRAASKHIQKLDKEQ